MGDPPLCPYCQSPNRMGALRCRMCGRRLREEGKPGDQSPPKPVVLERVMTGEVFTAVLGDARKEESNREAVREPHATAGAVSVDKRRSEATLNPNELVDVDDLAARASAAMELKRFERAIGYLDDILATSPRDPKALYRKGVCLANLQRHDEAIACYQKAIEENPEDAELWHRKSLSEKEVESYTDALFSVDRAIDIAPDFTDAWFSKGSVLQILGKLVEAYVCFLEVLRRDPNHMDALTHKNTAEESLANRGLQSLISGRASWKDLPPTMQYDPHSGPCLSKESLLSLSETCQSEERLDEGLYFCDQALERQEKDSFLWRQKADILSKMGRYTDAIRCQEEAMALDSALRSTPIAARKSSEPRSNTPVQPFRGQRTESGELVNEIRWSTAEGEEPPPGSVAETGTRSKTKREESTSAEIRTAKTQDETPSQEIPVPEEVAVKGIVASGQNRPWVREETESENLPTDKVRIRPRGVKQLQKTYLRGLDDALGGGIPGNHIVLIAGAPGTMKSSLAFFVLYNNALKEGKSGLYVTLEQTTPSLIGQMRSLGMEYEGVRDKLRILDLAHLRSRHSLSKEGWLEILYSRVKELKRKFDLSFLVIDPLDALTTIGGLGNKRQKTFILFEWLRQLDVTGFIITERPDFVIGGNVIQWRSVEDFLADGVLQMRLHLIDDVNVQRRIRCLKMREMRHNTAYMALDMDDGLFTVTRVVR